MKVGGRKNQRNNGSYVDRRSFRQLGLKREGEAIGRWYRPALSYQRYDRKDVSAVGQRSSDFCLKDWSAWDAEPRGHSRIVEAKVTAINAGTNFRCATAAKIQSQASTQITVDTECPL